MFTVNLEAMMGLHPAEEALLQVKFTPKDIGEQWVNCSGSPDGTLNYMYSPVSIFP